MNEPPHNESLHALHVLVADDEALARARLQRLLNEAGVGCVAEAENGEQALQYCLQHSPDAVFMDIEMPGMTGLQAAERIQQYCPQTRVIFCTAYDEFALKAFELNARDYLLKPFSRDRLQQALEKLPKPQTADSITVRVGTDLRRIPLQDIYYCQADHKYVTAYHRHGEIILDDSLNQLQNRFPEYFLRIHRNCLVNRQYLNALEQDGSGHFCVRLSEVDCALPVSRRNLSTVRKTLKNAR
jgi:two-component system response regulator AlgR